MHHALSLYMWKIYINLLDFHNIILVMAALLLLFVCVLQMLYVCVFYVYYYIIV